MKTKMSWPKILLIVLIVILVLLLIIFLAIHFTIKSNFERKDYPDYPTTNYYYEDYATQYPREERSFYSGENKLQAYLYGDLAAERLLIFAHGLGGGHESYMKELINLVEQGYLVFAYDATGSATSEGESTKGLLQSALDLQAALEFIDTEADLSPKLKYLMGHSWGGFAVAEALGYREDIVAVVALSAYAKPVDLLVDQASQMLNFDMGGTEAFFALSQLLSFGQENYQRNAVDSINASQTPILVLHGAEDELISLAGLSILAYADEIHNEHLESCILERPGQNGHSTIFRPTQELAYIAEKNEEFAQLMAEYEGELPLVKRQEYIDSVDLERVNQVNLELFTAILEFFDRATELFGAK